MNDIISCVSLTKQIAALSGIGVFSGCEEVSSQLVIDTHMSIVWSYIQFCD